MAKVIEKSLTNITEDKLNDILHFGILNGIRAEMKHRLMCTAEGLVDEVIKSTFDQLKGRIEAQYDYPGNKMMFNVVINGVPQSAI